MVTSALKTFWQEEDGQDLVEYSLLLAFLALAAISILSSAGANLKTMFGAVSNSLVTANKAVTK